MAIFSRLSTGTVATVGVDVGAGLGVAVALAVAVGVGARVSPGLKVGVGVAVAAGAAVVGVGVAVAAGPLVGVGVASSPQAKMNRVRATNPVRREYVLQLLDQRANLIFHLLNLRSTCASRARQSTQTFGEQSTFYIAPGRIVNPKQYDAVTTHP